MDENSIEILVKNKHFYNLQIASLEKIKTETENKEHIQALEEVINEWRYIRDHYYLLKK